MFFSHVVFLGFSILTNLVLSNLLHIHYFNSLGPTFTLFSLGIYAYLIRRYRLFDLRIKLHTTLTYSTTIAILVTLLITSTLHLPTKNLYLLLGINIALVILTILLFLPLKRRLSLLFEQLIFGPAGNFQKRLSNISKKISRENLGIRQACSTILDELNQTFGLQSCTFVLATDGACPFPAPVKAEHLRSGALYIDELESRAEIEDDRAAGRLARYFRSRDLAVIQPILHGDRLIGTLNLGSKRSGGTFSSDELDALDQLAKNTKIILANQPPEPQPREKDPRFEISQIAYNTLGGSLREIPQLLQTIQQTAPSRSRRPKPDQGSPVAVVSSITHGMGKTYRAIQYIDYITEIETLTSEMLRLPSSLTETITQIFEYKQIHSQLTDLGIFHTQPIIQRQEKVAAETQVRASEHYLQKVILELLLNAVIHGQEPYCLETTEDSESIIVRITSTGKLTQAEIQKAFKRGQQNINGKQKGAGYGLNLVTTFVTKVGGYFTLTSKKSSIISEIILPKVR